MKSLNEYTGIAIRNLQAFADDEILLSSVVELLATCTGTVFAIGIGKSSFIARKLAASLQSIDVRSAFLHPAEALHGDCGPVAAKDICLVVSKSGNSQEINALLPVLRARSVRVIALTNVLASPLAKAAELVVPLRVTEEGDDENLLPLISFQVSLFLCDFLVARLAARTTFTAERFRRNHPAGQIGFNLSRCLADLPDWQRRKPFVRANTPVLDTLIKISDSKVGMCCVTDDEEILQGVITDGDVRRSLTAGLDVRTVEAYKIMNRNPLTVAHSAPLSVVLNLMECGPRKISAAPVLAASGLCLGVIQIHDLLG